MRTVDTMRNVLRSKIQDPVLDLASIWLLARRLGIPNLGSGTEALKVLQPLEKANAWKPVTLQAKWLLDGAPAPAQPVVKPPPAKKQPPAIKRPSVKKLPPVWVYAGALPQTDEEMQALLQMSDEQMSATDGWELVDEYRSSVRFFDEEDEG